MTLKARVEVLEELVQLLVEHRQQLMKEAQLALLLALAPEPDGRGVSKEG